MPIVTRITASKRQPARRRVALDGRFAFACHENVVARFRLREGMALTAEQVQEIEQGQVRQACMDAALRVLQRRLHSRAELRRKLVQKEYAPEMVEGVLEELARLGYVDDYAYALSRAQSAAAHRYHGRRRAQAELMRAGVAGEVARRALDAVYAEADGADAARRLAEKWAPRLRRLEPAVARRRLAGMLQRRGFAYEDVRRAMDQSLGRERSDDE